MSEIELGQGGHSSPVACVRSCSGVLTDMGALSRRVPDIEGGRRGS